MVNKKDLKDPYEIKIPKFSNLFYRKENIAYTHNGVFHADDVCATALLEIVFPGIEIRRVARVPEDAELAFDIGYGKFDHHQQNAELRPDGNRYAAFGLLWREIGPQIVEPEDVKFFDDMFVKGIDYTDNTGYPNPFSSAIKAFNPSWESDEDVDECFREAVKFAKTAILNQLNRYNSAVIAKEMIQDMLSPENIDHYMVTNDCIKFDRYIPCQKYLVNTNINFVMYPSNRQPGYWNISTIPTETGSKIPKAKFPEKWLKHQPSGCTFIHPTLRLVVFKDKESALNAMNSVSSTKGYKREV